MYQYWKASQAIVLQLLMACYVLLNTLAENCREGRKEGRREEGRKGGKKGEKEGERKGRKGRKGSIILHFQLNQMIESIILNFQLNQMHENKIVTVAHLSHDQLLSCSNYVVNQYLPAQGWIKIQFYQQESCSRLRVSHAFTKPQAFSYCKRWFARKYCPN